MEREELIDSLLSGLELFHREMRNFGSEFAEFKFKKAFVIGGNIAANFTGSKRVIGIHDMYFITSKPDCVLTKKDIYFIYINQIVQAIEKSHKRSRKDLTVAILDVLVLDRNTKYRDIFSDEVIDRALNRIVSDEIQDRFNLAFADFSKEFLAQKSSLLAKASSNRKKSHYRGLIKRVHSLLAEAISSGLSPDELCQMIQEENCKNIMET